MKANLLSVIIPVYNKEKSFPRCIESVLNQSYPNIEIIVVDDGSTDNSPAVIDKYLGKDERIRVIHKKNEGLGFTRNSGIKASNGDYITFLDADDYVSADMYADMMQKIDENENIDIVYCDFVMEKDNESTVYMESHIDEGVYDGEVFIKYILGSLPNHVNDNEFDMSVCKGIFSKKIIDDFDVSFKSEREYICEDLYFDLEYFKYVRNVYFLKKCYYHYVMYSNSITHSYIENRLDKETFLYKKVNSMIRKDYDEETLLRYNRMFLGRVRCCIRQEVFKKQTLKKCLSSIKGIINDDVISTVINSYPISSCSITLKIFNTCIKYKLSLILYLLIKIKEEM